MDSKVAFQQLKAICVPLLGQAELKPSTIPRVSQSLSDLIRALQSIKRSAGPSILNTSLASYAFFPVSSILQRNSSDAIPSRIMIQLLSVLEILIDAWWWDCDLVLWDQVAVLCGSLLGGGGNAGQKGKGKERDDETKELAARCLFALFRERTAEERVAVSGLKKNYEEERLQQFIKHAQSDKLVPVVGQSLNALLGNAETRHRPLQLLSLKLISLILRLYAPKGIIPTILPGVISTMSKVSLGISTGKGWAAGEIVEAALLVMQQVILEAVSDAICIKEGALRYFDSLESLSIFDSAPPTTPTTSSKYATSRTAAWLTGTASQLHVALNNLSSLLTHTNTQALLALVKLSTTVLEATPLSLPQSQPLLLSFLLSLSHSNYPSVSKSALDGISYNLRPESKSRISILQTLVNTTQSNLNALPLLIPTHSDAKVEHLANTINAVCRLVNDASGAKSAGLQSMATALGRLFGPAGGVEKWGWSLLGALQLTNPSATLSQPIAVTKLLENEQMGKWVFPEIAMKHVSSTSAQKSLYTMMQSLGGVAGDQCLFSIEWFTLVAQGGHTQRGVSALWCACRMMEGAADRRLDSPESDNGFRNASARMRKFARSQARSVAEMWDSIDELEDQAPPVPQEPPDSEGPPTLEYSKGLIPLKDGLNITSSGAEQPSRAPPRQVVLHRCLSLQMLAITAGVLQAKFPSLLLHVVYPILHSIVSSDSFLSATGLATLNYVSVQSSYASPANLLLSNFDYALDSISRRLTRRWLDPEATKVMALLVRLVGKDIVDRAGDVVEECFDRLDDFHGYPIIVEGLLQVLREVIKAIEAEEEPPAREKKRVHELFAPEMQSLSAFSEWFLHRNDPPEVDTTYYGPAPKEAWSSSKAEDDDEESVQPNLEKQDPLKDPPPTPTQALAQQIVSRCLYFLTHGSPSIRAQILSLLATAVPVLPESALLPSIHKAWPFIINRLSDPEPYVISAAAALVEALGNQVGDFMGKRIWEDVWPRFSKLLDKLDAADSQSALARRGPGSVGTESAYTHSHRLYRSMLRTMTVALGGDMSIRDAAMWEVILAFRRFLHAHAHEELQACARELYTVVGRINRDAVWLALTATVGDERLQSMSFLRQPAWHIKENAKIIFLAID